jgi:hypothetical protein
MLRFIGLEAICLDKHHKVRGRQMLPAQLFGRPRGVASDRFAHVRQRCHRPPEGARGHNAFAVRNLTLEIEARLAAQFERQAHGDDAQTFADQPRIPALEIERRVDADRRQAGRQPGRPRPIDR